jgi:hypothetical protein
MGRNVELQKQRQREWYQQNKQRIIDGSSRRRKEAVEFVKELKSKPCMDCGNSLPPVCMDYHHVRGEKKYEINRMTRITVSKKLILEEIAKCDLLCANCHRQRHFA